MTRCSIFILLVTLVAARGDSVYQIAFSASLSYHLTLHPGQAVTYDDVFINNGNGYNKATGIFTCPQSGVYNFQIHAVSMGHKTFFMELSHNNIRTLALVGFGVQHNSSGNSAILHLKKGDRVWVRALGSSGLFGSTLYHYTTFSGFLISPSFSVNP